MDLIEDLKSYINALEKLRVCCLIEAFREDHEVPSAADVAAGQYVAYSTSQTILEEIISENKKEAVVNGS